MKYIMIIGFAIFFPFVSLSQMPEIMWQQCYGSSDIDYNNCIIDSDSGYLIGISLREYEPGVTNYHGGVDIWLVETDTVGNIIWERCYGGSAGEGPNKLLRSMDNGYYIIANTNSADGDVQSDTQGGGDYWIIKLDCEKNIIWEKCFGTPVGEGPRDALLTPDGGLIVMGRIHASGGDVSVYYGSNDLWLFKLDSLGNMEWEKTVGNEGNENGISMTYNSEGNIMLIGAASHHGGMVECYPDEDWGDVWLVELDLQGNIVSQHCYGGSSYDVGFNFLEIVDGYILSCYTSSDDGDVSGLHGPSGAPPNGHSDIWVVKLNEQFEIDWQKCIGGYDTDYPNYITQTTDNGFVIIGWTLSNDGDVSGNHSNPGWDTDIWVVKLDQAGEIEWQRCYGGWGSERLENPHTILKKSDYNYVIASSTDYVSDDVQCDMNNNLSGDAWVFEIKDCTQYAAATPEKATGPDTICSTNNAGNIYTTAAATNAWAYQWMIAPETAGTITGDSLQGTVSWSPDYEGTATIIVRSTNDCGESEWSQPHYTQVYTCLGVNELKAAGLTLKAYPNPATNYIIFELSVISNPLVVISRETTVGSDEKSPKNNPQKSPQIFITNTLGQQVAQLELGKNAAPSASLRRTVWDTKSVQGGMYFYKVEIDGKILSGKIVLLK